VNRPTRTVDGGFIVYVGTGEDRAPERGRFKAEAMALQDLANECSFPPKGARIEDHFDDTEGVLHRSRAKVAVEMQDCDQAKAAVEPARIRELANAAYAEQIRRYRDLIDEPEPEETAAPNPQLASTSAPADSSARFYVYRQQVYFLTERVILAPPTAFAPRARETVVVVKQLEPTVREIRSYEAAHPQIRASSEAFSTLRPNHVAHEPAALREARPERRARAATAGVASFRARTHEREETPRRKRQTPRFHHHRRG
jgi:hypothetical protein